ncbi:MAG: hypothetical protein AAGG45_08165, partial [Pseudomonadota bacterium]
VDGETMVVLIVLIVMATGLAKTWVTTKANARADTETLDRVSDLEKEVLRLRDRVKVLEKITTDGDNRLSDEISRLA